jgi:hypothetical protein
MSTLRSAVLTLLLAAGSAGASEPTLKPFVLAQRGPGDQAAAVTQVKEKLAAAGFELAGAYDPYPGATVLVVTSPELKAAAGRTPTGGFAAGERATVTRVGEEVQVAFANPRYLQHAYRLKDDLGPVAQKLEAALGRVEEFGPKDGKTAKDLAGYHYMFGMPYYDEPSEIATFGSHDQAVAVIEKGLAARRGGASKVYRIDVPGSEQTVFGVALTDGCGGDAFVMKEIDFKPLRSTPHLPYELLVTGSKVIALHAKFRIAVDFPDLAMMGSNSFMNIRCAPDAIEDALKRVAGTKR